MTHKHGDEVSERIEWVDPVKGKRQVADKWAGTYRCQFCGEFSKAKDWENNLNDLGEEQCPKCGRAYDVNAAILAQEGDD